MSGPPTGFSTGFSTGRPIGPSLGPSLGTDAHPATGPATRPTRDPYLDNVKLIGVVLVVIGHFWTALRDEGSIATAYLLLYLFHMPVFVLLAGTLSPTGDLTTRRLQGLAAGLMVPYLVFQTGYEVGEEMLGRNPGFDLLGPPWLMWFLAALVCWRLLAPLLAQLRGAVPLSVAVSLIGGTTAPDELALAQVMGLLPFFVVGLRLSRDDLQRLRAPALRAPAVAAFVVAAVACWYAAPHVDKEWIYWRSSYAELGVGAVEGMALRAGLLAVAFVLVAAFLVLVPGRRSRLTHLGARTMYAYLLHGFVVLAVTGAGLYETGWVRTPLGLVAVTSASAALALALMSDPVRRWTRPLVEPTVDRLWRDRSAESAHGVPHDVEHTHHASLDRVEVEPRHRVGAAVGLHHPGVKLR